MTIIRIETNELEERAQSLREQLQTLNHIHRHSLSSTITFNNCNYVHCVHYSVHHEKCIEESEAPAKDLKLLQREQQQSVQE